MSRAVVGILAYAAYFAIVASVLVQVAEGWAAGEVVQPATPMPQLQADAAVDLGEFAILTIVVDGPDESIEVPCATTTARTSLKRIHVHPDQVMVAVHRWCNTGGSE